MRRLHSLDDEIAACERAIAEHRDALRSSLRAADDRLRREVATPKVMLATAAAGYVIGRLTRAASGEAYRGAGRGQRGAAATPSAAAKGVGFAGLLGGLALSVLKAQLGTPGSWLNERIAERMRRARTPIDPGGSASATARRPAAPRPSSRSPARSPLEV